MISNLDNIASAASIAEREKNPPLMMTFLLSGPRTGSYALSQIMDTHYCMAHHEGHDFEVAFDEVGQGLSYEETNSCAFWRGCLDRGEHYFCCDQSCAPFLFVKALQCQEVLDRIRSGRVRLNIISIPRDPVDTLISLHEACKRAGIKTNPKAMMSAILIMDEMITSIIEENRQLLSQLGVMCLRTGEYERITTKDEKHTFLPNMIRSFAAITGAAGKIIPESVINREQPNHTNFDFLKDVFGIEDEAMLRAIEGDASQSIIIPNELFYFNTMKAMEVMKRKFGK